MKMTTLNLSIRLRTLKSVLQLLNSSKIVGCENSLIKADQVFLQHLSRQSIVNIRLHVGQR